MKHLFLLASLILTFNLAWAQKGPATASDTVKNMTLSHSYPKHTAQDLTQIEADAIREFITHKSVPNNQKKIVLVRYEVGDERVATALKEAIKAGISDIVVITDLNVSMDGQFKEGETHNALFDKAKIKEQGNPAKILKELLAMGFKINGAQGLRIFSQPLYNRELLESKRQSSPIMHEKELFLYSGEGEQSEYFRGFYGTANMNKGERYNRMFEIQDTKTLNILRNHALKLVEVYAKGEETSVLKDFNPVKMDYADGSFQEIAFTDGVRNPNDRITALLQKGVDIKDGTFKIKNILLSHFVFTNGKEVSTLKDAMEAQPEMTVQGVFDQQFLQTNNWGHAARLVGFFVDTPGERDLQPFGYGLQKRMEVYGYQRLSKSVKQVPLSGPPSFVHLWHDKTTVIDTEEVNAKTGQKENWTYIFTGSLNNSNHFENAELQILYRVSSQDPLAISIKDSILKVAQAEPEYALPLDLAVMRESMGRFLDHVAYDFTKEEIIEYMKLIRDGDAAGTEKTLDKWAKRKTLSEKKPDLAKVQKKIDQLTQFLDWFNKNVSPITHSKLWPQRLERIQNALDTEVADKIQPAIEWTLFSRELTPEKIQELTKQALKDIFNLEYKPPQEPAGPRREPKPTKSSAACEKGMAAI